MRKKRKAYTPEEKVGIIRRHLLDGMAVSDLCDEHDLNPTVYYRWQKEFFAGGAADGATSLLSPRWTSHAECRRLYR